MKVLLVQPPKPRKSVGIEHLYLDEPLALEYLAADLPPCCVPRILDMRLDRDLAAELARFQPDMVGVTGYTVHVPVIRAICQQVKRLQPQVLTVVGGHHATVAPQDFLHSSIDVIVIGDGIPTLREIVQKVAKGEDHRQVRGIAFSENGRLCRTEARPLTDLDDFPLPDRSITAQYRKHYHSEWMQPSACLRTSRGCPFRCNFCAMWKVTEGRYLTRSVESILRELAQIGEDYILFADDESFLDARRMSRLAEAIEAEGIQKKYVAYARSDTVVRNPRLLEQWKGIGLHTLLVGLEFYAQEDLDYVGKGTSCEQNQQAIELLRSLDVRVSPLFMLRPDYDAVSFETFARYVKESNFDTVTFSMLTPLPGTDLYEQVKQEMLDVDFEYFDFVHTVLPTKLPLKEYYQRLNWLYRNSIRWRDYFAYLLRFPIDRAAAVSLDNYRLMARVKNLYKDY